jgi:hypothetical protein
MSIDIEKDSFMQVSMRLLFHKSYKIDQENIIELFKYKPFLLLDWKTKSYKKLKIGS